MSQNTQDFKEFYDQHELLGTGAFAEVRLCRHKKTGTTYAAKTVTRNVKLTKNTKDDYGRGPKKETKMTMFDIEIDINRHLHHENIVNLIEFFRNPKLVMVFELVTGGELFDDIEKNQYYNEDDAARCVRQLLSGVEYIHENDILHRDLKPENLLLDRGKNIKIADFGLAVKLDGPECLTQGVAGTPDYTAPEVLKEEYYGTKVDVWSSGVILYILLCGYPPFSDDDEPGEGVLEYDAEDWEGVSESAKDLIANMVCVDVEKRYTATKSLQHEWINSRTTNASLNKASANIRRFNARRKLKAGFHAVVAMNRAKRFALIRRNLSDQIHKEEATEAEAKNAEKTETQTEPTVDPKPTPAPESNQKPPSPKPKDPDPIDFSKLEIKAPAEANSQAYKEVTSVVPPTMDVSKQFRSNSILPVSDDFKFDDSMVIGKIGDTTTDPRSPKDKKKQDCCIM